MTHQDKVSKPIIPSLFKMSQSNRLLSLALHSAVIGSAALALSACQSTPNMTTASQTSPIIDFSVADTQANRAQSHLFNTGIDANNANYERLFDQAQYPNGDNLAKQKLVSAIRQHLATEHVAVAKAKYHLSPLVNPDSIDAGSSSLFQTAIEVIAYQESMKEDDYDSYDDEDFEDYEDTEEYEYDENAYDCNNEVCIVDVLELAETDDDIELAQDECNICDDDYESFDAYEEVYAEEEYNYEEEYAYEDLEEYDDESDYDKALGSIKSVKPSSIFEAYEAVQLAKQNNESAGDSDNMAGSGILNLMLGMMQKTPEQLDARNAYQMRYLTLNSVSQYQPNQRQFKSVYSYDYAAPTVSASFQLPVALDFDTSRLTIDASAFMPLMALVSPENTPLPNEMVSHTVDIGLPEVVTEQIPSAVIYDATISAVQASLAELDPKLFSLIDISGDDFAKQVGAAQGIKVYFGSHQTGEVVGKIFKHVSQSLEQHVDANPTQYPDGALLKSAIRKVQLYNKGYQSDDVGSLLQLIEAIMPISFNQVNYYYLDSAGQLLGKQQRINMGSNLADMQVTTLNQIRYDHKSYQSHSLKPLLEQSFGDAAPKPIDGNAWLKNKKQKQDKIDIAREARYEYFNDENESFASYDVEEYDLESDDLESSNNDDISLEY